MVGIRVGMALLLFLFSSPSISHVLSQDSSVSRVDDGVRRQALSLHPKGIVSSANLTIPTSANVAGQFGAFFKTKVSIVNVTSRSYTIYATLYRNGGGTTLRSIAMSAFQALNYDNFLQDVFGYTGAGGIELDAWFDPPGGDALNEFAVTAEVYADSPNGRFKTVVNIPAVSDSISSTSESVTPGIFVDGSSRTNVGCVNISSLSSAVDLDLYNSAGALLNGYTINIPANGWAQIPIQDSVSGGYLIWTLQTGTSPDCFAVVVDNRSNDGSFISPVKYVN